MGSRAHIAVEHADGTATWSYVHFDGYVSYTGMRLQLNYNSYESACKLVEYPSVNIVRSDACHLRPIDTSNTRPRAVNSISNVPYCEYTYIWHNSKWWIKDSVTRKLQPLDVLVTYELLAGSTGGTQ